MYFCSISSGSSGNCVYIASEKTNVLIDIGVPKKTVVSGLSSIGINPFNISAILVTHEHLDHIKGVGIFARSYNIPVYINNLTYNVVRDNLKDVQNINIIENDKFSIGDLDINTFKLPHDAVNPIGYSISHGNKRISIATDIGYVSKDILENLMNSNIVLIESNYNEDMLNMSSYPYFLKQRIQSDFGHLSNEECARTIIEIIKNFPKRIILGHLSKTSNFPELAYKTIENLLFKNNLKIGKDLNLTVAHRILPSNYMKV